MAARLTPNKRRDDGTRQAGRRDDGTHQRRVINHRAAVADRLVGLDRPTNRRFRQAGKDIGVGVHDAGPCSRALSSHLTTPAW